MKRIYVIEDEDAVRENIVDLLDAEGYSPSGYADGDAGLQAVWESAPDLIICDILMPRMGGFDVAARLRSDPRTADIPFIFLTALSDRENYRRGMELGADDFITKPFTRRELLTAIETRLGKHARLVGMVERADRVKHAAEAAWLPHEFLSAINTLLVKSEALAGGLVGRPADRGAAEQMQALLKRLLHLTQNYLFLSDLDRLQQKEDETPHCRAQWLVETCCQLKARDEHRVEDLRLAVADAGLAMSGQHLEALVEELIHLALQYSTAGQAVEVNGRVEPGTGYLLEVTYPGQEMPPAAQPTVAGGPATGWQSGGLELVVVRRIVEIDGGDFSIESTPGLQTVAQVRLPLAGNLEEADNV